VILAGPVVLVRLPNWLGDTVMALPALRGLRASLPESRITLVGRWASLLKGQAVAEALVAYPGGQAARRRIAHVLRESRPDTAIVLSNSFESALAARLWGARVRLGYEADLRGWLLTHTLPLPSPRLHQVDEYCRLVEEGGAPTEAREPAWTLVPDPLLDGEVAALLAAIGLTAGERAVGLHLGAAFGSSKLWDPAAYAELASRLDEVGVRAVLLGSAADRATADTVLEAAGRPIPSLVGRDRAALLPRLLARLGVLVSGDTGVAHLAAAVGTPTVTLFGPTDPGLTSPRGAASRPLQGHAPCAPCFLTRCPIEHPCMRTIAPEVVAKAVLEARAA
jgi:lipopolysaccharide heptosyltransferase II